MDTAIEPGDRVPPEYDNLIAKLMVHAADRPAAIDRLRRALDETEITGIQTTLPFHRFVARNSSFRAGSLSTGWVGEQWDGPAHWQAAARLAQQAIALAALDGTGDGAAGGAGGGTATGGSVAPGASRREPGPAVPMEGAWRRTALDAGVDRWPR